MRVKMAPRAIARTARRPSTDHRQLLLATLYLGAVILAFNAWVVMR